MESWTKTLLISYKYLSTIVSTIDEMVGKISLNSYIYNRKNTCDTMGQFDKIIELNDRKCNLINLKVITEEALGKLKEKELRIAMLIYVDGLTCDETASAMGISRRTVFRKKNIILDKITKVLKEKYSCEYFMKNYINEQWLMELYYYYCNKAKTMTIEQTIDLAEEVDSGRAIYKTIKELQRSIA